MRFVILFCLICISVSTYSQQYWLFIGTYTHTGSKGIYVYRFDAATGKTQWVSNTEGIINPSYLAIAPGAKYLYACTETRTVNAGSISAFAFDHTRGKLNFINKQASGSDNPVYVSVHKNSNWIATCNYSGGSVAVCRIDSQGRIQPFSQNIFHEGKSINKERQEKAHPHSTLFSPEGDRLIVPDLGLDKVMVYYFNADAENPLKPFKVPYASSVPGSGPRHFTFHPNKKYCYLVEELSGTVGTYKYRNGKLRFKQRLETHPPEIKEGFGSADIHVSPDGNFLYVSNRGNENTITIFSIHRSTGKLSLVGYQPTLGKTPRNFVIDPSGNFLLVANQETGNIIVFKRNRITGLLEPTGDQINIPQPSCLIMTHSIF